MDLPSKQNQFQVELWLNYLKTVSHILKHKSYNYTIY